MRMIGFPRVPVYWLRNPYVIITGIGLIGFLTTLLVSSLWIWPKSGHANKSHTSATSTRTSQTAPPDTPVSPFIFGSNLPRLDGHNQVVLTAPSRAVVQQLHLHMLRIPPSSERSPVPIVHAATIIKGLGVMPLVVLDGPMDPTALQDDTKIIKIMNVVFGQDTVYYEYDNEADLGGSPGNSYTISWNSVIPALKQLAPQGKFIGPVNYQYNQQYLSAFLQQAQPEPDGVSWHEYSCNAAWSQALCLANISLWTTHISNARSTMTALIGKDLPILITEWNYAANAASNDGKSNDSNFMTAWTTRAMQTLVANLLFAAIQYSSVHPPPPL